MDEPKSNEKHAFEVHHTVKKLKPIEDPVPSKSAFSISSFWLYLFIALFLVGLGIAKIAMDQRREVRSMNVIITMLEDQQKASGYIQVIGAEGIAETTFIMELLKIYGFIPYLNNDPAQQTPLVRLNSETTIDEETLLKVLSTIPIANFHEGYKNAVILYGIETNTATTQVRDLLNKKGINFQFIDLGSDDPSIPGIGARLYLSGYDPNKAVNNGMYLEYQNKMYPDPDLYAVIDKIKR